MLKSITFSAVFLVAMTSAAIANTLTFTTPTYSPSPAIVGQQITIYVSTTWNGGGMSSNFYVDVSMPGVSSFDSVSGDFQTENRYSAGQTAWHANGNQIQLSYALAEGYSSSWNGNTTKMLVIKYTPTQAGTQYIYVRNAWGINSYTRNPSASNYTDQQGWPVSRYSFTVYAKPDLQFAAGISTSPANPTTADTVEISVSFRNAGGSTASNFSVRVWLNGTVIATFSISSLAASNTTVRTVTVGPLQSGGYFVNAELDSGGTVNESNENNNDNIFTFDVTPATIPLTVNVNGQGSVSPNSGNYPPGSNITLTATPAVGWQFAGWSGGASGNSPTVTITINSATTVTATFTQLMYALTVNVVGQGNATPTSGNHPAGSTVTLTATPAAGWQFAGWSGGASGNSPTVTITINSATTITATFTQIMYALTVNVVGQGSVTPNSGSYPAGSTVTLVETPAAGWQFAGWSGGASGNSSTVTITINSSTTVTATFTQQPPPPVTMSVSPTSLAFAYQEGQTPAPQTTTIDFVGGSPAWSMQATNGYVAGTPSAGNGSQSISVAIVISLPAGQYADTITITCAGASPNTVQVPVTISVSAVPANPLSVNFSHSPLPNDVTDIDFGETALNTPANVHLTVKNISALMVTVTATITAPFELIAGGTNFTLAANATHDLIVRYRPTAIGFDTGTITLDTGNFQTTIDLAGNAVARPATGLGTDPGPFAGGGWMPSTGALGTTTWDANQIIFASGKAFIVCRETAPGYFVSGQLESTDLFRFGRYTFHIEPAAGLLNAWFVYGVTGDEFIHEIDFEFDAQNGFATSGGHRHPSEGYSNASPTYESTVQNRFTLAPNISSHEFVIEWEPGRIVWFVDGARVHEVSDGSVPTRALKIMVHTRPQTGLFPGQPPAQATMIVHDFTFEPYPFPPAQQASPNQNAAPAVNAQPVGNGGCELGAANPSASPMWWLMLALGVIFLAIRIRVGRLVK